MKLFPRCPARGGGGQYVAGGGGGHVEVYPAAGDPPQDITGVGPVWEPYNMKVWLNSKNLNSELKKRRELYLWSIKAWGWGII
jgi:hypothetical protein